MRRITLTAIALLLFGFSSTALAVDPNFYNVTVPGTTFYVTPGVANNVFSFQYDFSSGGQAEVAVTEQIRDINNNIIYEFGGMGADDKAAGHYQLDWNGTYKNGGANDGKYTTDGKYKLYLFADTHMGGIDSYSSPLFSVSVSNVVAKNGPTLELSTPTDNTFDPTTETFNVSYKIDRGTYPNADVNLNIYGPLGNNSQQRIITKNINTNGNYTMTWDGTMNGVTVPDGEYTYTLQAQSTSNLQTIKGNLISGTFSVMSTGLISSSVSLSNLTVFPDPYNPSGYATFKYSLEGSSGNAIIYAAIYNSNDTKNALKTWQFDNQSTGSNSILWNGVADSGNKIGVGGYIFKVWGSEYNKIITPQQTSFTVVTKTSDIVIVPPVIPSSSCVFPDVTIYDPDCAAFKYVYSIHAITGTGNGNLEPGAYVQRDQMAKVVLEMYNLNKVNACNAKPFPDVELSDWASNYICRGVDLGIIFGYSAGDDKGMYRSGRSVNHAETIALLLRPLLDTDPELSVLSQYNDVSSNVWFSHAGEFSHTYKIFPGDILHADYPTTRRELAVAIYNLHIAGWL